MAIAKKSNTKGKRYTPEQRAKIVAKIKKAIAGGRTTMYQACIDAGISDATYYNWTGRTAESKGKGAKTGPASAKAQAAKQAAIVGLTKALKDLNKMIKEFSNGGK